MMQKEQDRLETALRQIQPSVPPPELLIRLRAAKPAPPRASDRPAASAFPWARLFAQWRALAYGAPAAGLLLVLWVAWHPAGPAAKSSSLASSAVNSNAVQVGHSLLASFDTVAQLPGGAPVRFRCREWQDDVVIHDRTHGVEVTQSTPRLEVIPVRFETY